MKTANYVHQESNDFTVAKAKTGDIAQVHQLINFFAGRGEMLSRSLSELYENMRECFIVRSDKQVIACSSLHIFWSDLAEVRSLAVAEDKQMQGIGAKLVEACLDEAEQLGIAATFCLTYKPAFFKKLGFSVIDKKELPQKVWTDCYRCPKFPECDEVALIHHRDV